MVVAVVEVVVVVMVVVVLDLPTHWSRHSRSPLRDGEEKERKYRQGESWGKMYVLLSDSHESSIAIGWTAE